MRRAIKAAMAALSLGLLAGLLALSVLAVALDAPLMAEQFRRFSVHSGLEDAAFAPVAEEVVAFLDGRIDTLPTFNARENAHMADVQLIFRWVKAVCALALPCAVGLWLGRRRGSLRVYWITVAAVAAVAAGIALWAAVDFDSLFIAFHHLLFTNDLWLLDPRTDLMIRLMPTGFFVDYAVRIGVLFGALAVVSAGAAALYQRRCKQ